MKKSVGPARALAVILSASFAFSNVITVSAASGDNAAELTGSIAEEEPAKEASSDDATAEDSSAEEENTDKDDAGKEENEDAGEESTEEVVASDTEASEETENAEESEENEDSEVGETLLEEVDPTEEGLESFVTAITAEETELPVEEKDPEEQTRVIIVMEGDAVLDKGYDTENLAENSAAMNLSESILAEQEETIEKISEEALNGETLEVNYNFSILTNAVSADVAYKDIDNIVNVDGVAAVYVAPKYEPMETADPMTITSGDMVGSYSTWAAGYTGAGTRIAIIDTGIDSDHPSFDAGAFDTHIQETAEAAGKTVDDYDLLSREEIATVLPNLNASQRSEGLSADQLYLNDKIPFAFNYVDKNLDITHDNDDEGDHGTHVSGISTANYYVPDGNSETGYARQEVGVVGIAPDAQLITMKVFGTNGGAYSDDYMAAIEDAILLKADVVNLSLGSSAAGYSSDSEAYINEIFEKLKGTSTVVSISAGNSGRWSDNSTYGVNLSGDVNQDTVGSPGSYLNAFTVASAVNSGLTGHYFSTDDGKRIFYTDGNETLAPAFETLDSSEDGSGKEYPFVFLTAKGTPADYEGVDVSGKIVFVQRGEITFGEKQMNAEKAGAIAVVIYNNQAGSISMTLQGSTAVIPAVSITLADAESIAAGADKISDTVYEGTITVTNKVAVNRDVANSYTMSTFSSYGVPGTLDLKPEITAPGGNIYSTRDGGTYGLMSGTSMAAPSISGQSALVEQYIREKNLAPENGISVRTLAQSLLMSTAIPLHEGNDPAAPEFSPRSQGAGLANVYNAVTSPSYILVGDKDGNDGKVKAVLGDDPEKTGKYSFSFDIYNMSDKEQFYVLDSTVMTEELYDGGGVNYFYGTSHKLNPSVSLYADDTTLVYDLNQDGRINRKDKRLFLEAVNESEEVAIIDEYPDYFDFNNDGVVNTRDVYLFGKQLSGAVNVANLGLEVVRVEDSTKINVEINLSDSDREYLTGFENGIYVDGFIYVNGNVDLSVPFLAFYGSWMDSPMYETFDFEEYVHNPDYNAQTYCGISKTNFLSIFPMGSENENYYIPNFFADDEKYVSDRNAISSENGTKLGSQYYSLIRNANRVLLTITDKNTGDVYFKKVEYENYASFVYNGQWKNYIQAQELNWAGTDAEGKPLPDGTEVEITLEAVPSYYDNVEDPSTLTGKGLYMSIPMAIDNVKPQITGLAEKADGSFVVTVSDNRYTAALLVLDSEGKIVSRYAVNQNEKGQEAEIEVEPLEGQFYIELFDYACNASVYRFSREVKKDDTDEEKIDKDGKLVADNVLNKDTVKSDEVKVVNTDVKEIKKVDLTKEDLRNKSNDKTGENTAETAKENADKKSDEVSSEKIDEKSDEEAKGKTDNKSDEVSNETTDSKSDNESQNANPEVTAQQPENANADETTETPENDNVAEESNKNSDADDTADDASAGTSLPISEGGENDD